MKTDWPKISVITPSLNAGKYIEQAIQSVLAQNYPNFEHIIIDGGSTDDTIETFKKYPHIKWVSERDKGQSDAMNKGFKMSSGEIIVYLNADDYFEPDAFNTAVKYLNKEKGIYFVVGECNMIDDADNILPGYKNPRVTFYEMLQWWRYLFPLNPSSYFYYREVQDEVGGFDEEKHYAMDYDFLLKVANYYKLFKVDEVLGTFRYIPGGKSYESYRTNHWKTQLVFVREYWKYLNARENLFIKISWLYYLIFGRSLKYGLKALGKITRAVFKLKSFKMLR